jgi:hypothetical protein
MAGPVERWDFGWMAARAAGPIVAVVPGVGPSPVASASRPLDVDTGGGELLASLGPLPVHTWATEGLAGQRSCRPATLEPLGVTVLAAEAGRVLLRWALCDATAPSA